MAEKAILVTNANVEKLNNRFQADGTGVPAAVGYYLVAQFGQDGAYEMLSAANFNAKYVPGNALLNGFFEAIRK